MADGRAHVLLRSVRWVEAGILTLIVGWLVGITGLQIIARNLNWTLNLAWADSLIRVSILWLGLVGAVAAAREYRHIRIDLVARFLPQRPGAAVETVTTLFACLVCGLLGWHGTRFVIDERVFASGSETIPLWILQSVMPVCFFVIALIYLFHAVLFFLKAIGAAATDSEPQDR